jgi:thymidylate synthase (FAD)
MKIIKPSFEILTDINGIEILKSIEKAGRVCYKSEDKITENSALKFVENIIKREHEAVIEHYNITVKFICDRGVSHEIVRHRIASYAQESTRYCNYSNDKFGNELTFIRPQFFYMGSDSETTWGMAMEFAEKAYFTLLDEGATPQEARTVLPNSLKTEIVVTMNLREWRHFFKLRTAKAAHPQMRELVIPLLNKFKELIPIVFDDIIVE